MKLARIVEAEIDAAQPRTLKPGDRGALEFGMIEVGSPASRAAARKVL